MNSLQSFKKKLNVSDRRICHIIITRDICKDNTLHDLVYHESSDKVIILHYKT